MRYFVRKKVCRETGRHYHHYSNIRNITCSIITLGTAVVSGEYIDVCDLKIPRVPAPAEKREKKMIIIDSDGKTTTSATARVWAWTVLNLAPLSAVGRRRRSPPARGHFDDAEQHFAGCRPWPPPPVTATAHRPPLRRFVLWPAIVLHCSSRFFSRRPPVRQPSLVTGFVTGRLHSLSSFLSSPNASSTTSTTYTHTHALVRLHFLYFPRVRGSDRTSSPPPSLISLAVFNRSYISFHFILI